MATAAAVPLCQQVFDSNRGRLGVLHGNAIHRHAVGYAIEADEPDARFDLLEDGFQPAVFKNDLHKKYPLPKTRRIARSRSHSS